MCSQDGLMDTTDSTESMWIHSYVPSSLKASQNLAKATPIFRFTRG